MTGQTTTQRITLQELQQQVDKSGIAQNILYSGQIQNFLGGNLQNLNVESSFILSSEYLKSSSNYTTREQIRGLFDQITASKIVNYNTETSNYLALKRRYIDFIVNESKKQQDQINPNDP